MATWQIETLKYTNDSDKVVTRTHWRCYDSKEAGGKLYTAEDFGVIRLDKIQADASGFIAYSDLTEAKCLEWVHAKVNKTEIETRIAESLESQINPVAKMGKPW